MVTCMYGGEWWMMNHSDKHQQQTFFPVNLRLSTAWIPNQTSVRHILKSRFRKKMNALAVCGEETIITTLLVCWFLAQLQTMDWKVRALRVFLSIKGGCPKQNKSRGLSELQKCTCDMKTSNTSRRHVNSTQHNSNVAFFHCHVQVHWRSTPEIQRQRWVLSDTYSDSKF